MSNLESEIAARASVAPRVTPADIEANVIAETYFTGADGVVGASAGQNESLLREYATYPGSPLSLITICILTLRNGFTVVGHSACASPENFNAEIGRRVAREAAIREVWPLMGYALRTQLAEGA